VEETTPPGGGPPPHVHSDEDETLYVLEGEVEFLLGDTAAGDLLRALVLRTDTPSWFSHLRGS